MRITELPMEPFLLAHTRVHSGGQNYEVVTLNLEGNENDEVPGFSEDEITKLPYVTKVYRLHPISKPLHPSEVDIASNIVVNDDWRRDLTEGSYLNIRSSDEDAAALVHDETVTGLIDGKTVLLSPCERLAISGIMTY